VGGNGGYEPGGVSIPFKRLMNREVLVGVGKELQAYYGTK